MHGAPTGTRRCICQFAREDSFRCGQAGYCCRAIEEEGEERREGGGVLEWIIAALLEQMKDLKRTASSSPARLVLKMYQARKFGSTDSLDEAGEEHLVKRESWWSRSLVRWRRGPRIHGVEHALELSLLQRQTTHGPQGSKQLQCFLSVRLSDLQHTVGGQHLDYERKQNRVAKGHGELAEEIVGKGLDPKQETLWWTSTFAVEAEEQLVIEGADKFWIIPFVKKFDCWVKVRVWDEKGNEERRELVVQGGPLAPQQGNHLVEGTRHMSTCGFGWLCGHRKR